MLESTIDDLNGQIETLSVERNELEKRNAEAAAQLAELDQQRNEALARIDEVTADGQSQVDGLQNQINDLNSQITDLTADRDRIAGELETSSANSLKLASDFESLNGEKGILQGLISSERAETSEKIAGLEGQIADLTGERDQLVSDLESAKEQSAQLTLSGESLNKERVELQNMLDAEQESAATNATKLAEMEAQITTLNEELASAKASGDESISHIKVVEQQLAEMTLARDNLTGERDKLQVNMDASKTQVGEMGNQLAALEQQLDGLSRERESIQSQLDSLSENSTSQITELQTTVDDLQTTIGDLTAKNAATEDEKSALQAKIDGLMQENQGIQDQLVSLEAESTSQIAALNSSLDDLNGKNATVAEERAALEARLSDATAENDAIKASSEQLAAQRSELIKERDYLSGLLDTEREAVASAASEAESLQGQIDSLTGDVETLKTRLAQSDERGAASAARADELQAQADDFENRVGALSSQLSILSESRDSAQLELNALRDQLGSAESLLGGARDEIEKLMAVKVSTEERMQAGRRKAEDTGDSVAEALRQAGLIDTTVQVRGDNSVGIRVSSGSLFNTGSAVVSESGRDVLAVVGQAVSSYEDYDIRVEGHTDDVPIGSALRQRFQSNWELSVARATSAVRFLSANTEVAANRLSATGYGEFNPIASNDTDDGREQNRRVEVVLYPK